jgi:hypothetical protein
MRRLISIVAIPTALFALFLACGNSGNGGASAGGINAGDGGSSSSSGSSGGGTIIGIGDDGSSGGSSGGGVGGAVPCPAGLQCNAQCPGGATTSISGKVYDPALKDPLYNVAVFVPAMPLQPLPKGVPMGADACSCAALYKSGAIASTSTGADGSFKLTSAPAGSAVPLVLQIGKWRRVVTINVTACQDNPQADKSLALPGTVAPGDTDNSMPDIAVSTGYADTLECLMLRIGVRANEYVAGPGGTGHIHVYSGGQPGTAPPATAAIGYPETHPMPGAPESDTNLWDSTAHLMPFDITLLSCEGAETYNANPSVLEEYLNAGGRVFASHYHYSWFAGALLKPADPQTYSPPADWGSNLASWHTDIANTAPDGGVDPIGPVGGSIDQTLNGSSAPFPKGQALFQWLGVVNALGQNGVPAQQASIYQPRYNAVVGAANPHSQSWITSTGGVPNQTMYFSFDTPVNAPAQPDGGLPNYCGRTVFSDLHVAGNPSTKDTSPPPVGCQNVDLSPQEKALEFMLFDLSSCVAPDKIVPPVGPVQ